jgi:hypothetical protein
VKLDCEEDTMSRIGRWIVSALRALVSMEPMAAAIEVGT